MTLLATDEVRYEVSDRTAYVTLNRPEKHNALTPTMIRAGGRAIRVANDDDNVRAIIVTGAGEEAFCAGADLETTIPRTVEGDLDISPGEDDLWLRDDLVTTPIIAAVNGGCIAGGMELLQATDIRIAEDHARFGLQEPRWGITPIAGSHVRLPRQIPYCRAMEYLLTGDIFSAEQVQASGLVNEVVPKGESLARAEKIAASIAENSPFAVRKIKETVLRCSGRPYDEAFAIESEIGQEVFDSEDAREGPQSFIEGTEPSFRP